MLAKDLRQEPKAALLEKAAKLREEVFKAQFKATTEPIDKPHEIREKKRDIARIATILHAQDLAAKPRAPKLSRGKRGTLRSNKASVQAKKDHLSRMAAEKKRAAEQKAKSHAKAAGGKAK
jgi:ribosomal protein L29